VRRHLSWLEHSASAISAIRKRYAQRVLGKHGLPLESICGPDVKGPDFNHAFLTLRRLVTGFDHLSMLSAVWSKVRAVSDDQLCDSYSIGKTLQECVEQQGSCFGIKKEELSQAYWEYEGMKSDNYLPIQWALAIYMLYMEISWRPDDNAWVWTQPEYTLVLEYDGARRAFGKERMVLMFGEDKPPYVEVRRGLLEKGRREHAGSPYMAPV
jgi:hypothetical protein